MAEFAEGFDIQAARDAGATDAQIADFLAVGSEFDIETARQNGIDDSQISNFLVTGQQPERVGVGGAFGGGATRGVSTILGAPVDVASGVLNIGAGLIEKGAEAVGADIDLGRIERPIGGSERIQEDIEGLTGGRQFENIQALPKESRIAAKAGEVVGASGPFALTPLALARTTVRGGAIFGPILTAARNTPTAFAITEAGGITGAAGGAALAEAADPGDVGTAFFAEVTGGLINPLGLAGRVFGGAKNQLLTTIGSFTKTGRQARAAEIIQAIVAEAGEDPKEIVRILSLAGRKPGTAGQLSGSVGLVALERKLAASNPKFSNKFQEGIEESLIGLRRSIDALSATGDPAALATAARLRERYFDEIFTRLIDDAESKAISARVAAPGDVAGQGVRVEAALQESLSNARTAETALWDKIPKNEPITLLPLANAEGAGLATRTQAALSRLLPEEVSSLGPGIKAAERISRDGVTTSGELLKLRRRALAGARQARSTKNFTEAGVLDEVAAGALDDLSVLSGTEVDVAREFSSALNDRFTRSFGGKGLATTGTGERRITPELLLERAFGGGKTRGATQFRELREAGAFPEGSPFGGVIRNEQESFLVDAAAKTTDPSGAVNPEKLQKFIADNSEILDEFPGLRTRLSNAATAEVAFRETQTTVATSKKALQKESFARLIGVERPAPVIGAALRGPNPIADFRSMASVAREGGEASVGGLRAGVMDFMMSKATGANGLPDMGKLRTALTEPLGKGKANILQVMRAEKIIDADSAKRLESLLDDATKIDNAIKSSRQLDQVIDDPNALFDLVVRITGANVGSAAAIGGSGSSLIAAQRGSKFARDIFEKLPGTRITEVLIEAAENPKLMALLLEKPSTVKRAADISRQINSFLIGAGIVSQEEE